MTVNRLGLSYIVPVYNEEESIVQTLESLESVFQELNILYEIIIVDDGSTDGTPSRLKECDKENVLILVHPVNAGYGAAIKTGLLASKYEWVGIVDADGSYDIKAIPRLVEKAEKGFDMVVGERENIHRTDSIIKGIFRRGLRYIVWLLVDKDIADINSGFRIFRKSAAMEFFPFLCSTFSFTTSLTILFSERGLFVEYVPTEFFNRKGNTKVRHIRDSLRATQMILQGVSYFNPIKVFVLISVLMIIVVCIPAMILAMIGMATLSGYYMVFGSVVTLLVGIGILGDVVRVSAVRTESRDFRLNVDSRERKEGHNDDRKMSE